MEKTQQRGQAGASPSLPPTLSESLLDWLPEWVQPFFVPQRRQLLLLERRLQRRLYREYRAQLREVSPTLRVRGRMVGEALVEALTGNGGSNASPGGRVTYADVVASSLAETPLAERLPLREVLVTLDPLLTPVLDPFVEGVKAPIYSHVGRIERQVATALVLSALGSGLVGGLAGYALGRLRRRGDG